jgi:hypothetical protein
MPWAQAYDPVGHGWLSTIGATLPALVHCSRRKVDWRTYHPDPETRHTDESRERERYTEVVQSFQ